MTPPLFARDSVLLSVKAADYGAALALASEHLAYLTGQRAGHILDALQAREARGGTGMGGGLALPHARIERLRNMCGVFLRLAEPVAYEAAPDGQAVGMLAVILAPETAQGEYLRRVGMLAALLRHPEHRDVLKASDSKDEVFALLTREEA